MLRVLTAIMLAVAMLAAPAVAQAQSAGDDQYVDPFQGGDGGGQEQPAEEPEQPAEEPEQPAAPAPAAPEQPAEPAPGGNGTVEPAPAAEVAQPTSPTLPRTGAPVILLAAAGYGLLLAGIAIRRKA